MRRDAAWRCKQHQMVSCHPNTDFLALAVIGMTGENGFKLAAGRQLQAIQRRCALKCSTDYPRFQVALRRVDDIVRSQQDIHGAAADARICPVATQNTQFGAHRFGVYHLPANEIPLSNEAGNKGVRGS